MRPLRLCDLSVIVIQLNNLMTEIHVAAAVIKNDKGEVLLSLRHEHTHQGGLWEFPGGKLDDGEVVYDALVRELREELGIEVEEALPLIRVRHAYADRSVLLDVWEVLRYQGEPGGCEGQALQWVDRERLTEIEMPAADVPIINAVRLPSQYMISGSAESQEHYLALLESALQRGVRLVQLRAKSLDEAAYQALVEQAIPLCHRYGAHALLNASPELVLQTGADGVHLDTPRLMALEQRPLPASHWVVASCHNREELQQAQAIGADFVVLSPVLPTQSHPGAPALGWEAFRELCELAQIPVFALGGMTAEMHTQAREYGAQGIAAISVFWSGK